jgi:hypothetical protein
MTPMNILWLLGIILGVFVIGGLIAFTFWVFTLRKYILVVRPGKRDFIRRRFFFPKGNILEYKGKTFFFTKECLGSVNGKTAIRINPDYPTALVWTDQEKNLKWDFLSVKAIMETMNSKHAEIVAMAGKEKMQMMDMILIIMCAIVIFLVLIALYRIYSPTPVQCILNATKV